MSISMFTKIHQSCRNDSYVDMILTAISLTNSTAQGGGGSFRNRKPIGEVGCCESRMAERIH